MLALGQVWEVEGNPESSGSPGSSPDVKKYLEKHLFCSSKEDEQHYAAQYELQMYTWLELWLAWSLQDVWPYFNLLLCATFDHICFLGQNRPLISFLFYSLQNWNTCSARYFQSRLGACLIFKHQSNVVIQQIMKWVLRRFCDSLWNGCMIGHLDLPVLVNCLLWDWGLAER